MKCWFLRLVVLDPSVSVAFRVALVARKPSSSALALAETKLRQFFYYTYEQMPQA